MQSLPDALGQQDLVSQSLLSKRYSTACDNHHLPAFILQHGHLAEKTRTVMFILVAKVLVKSWTEFDCRLHQESCDTCSTIDARRPSASPHSSRVTTALPSFTTIRLACFNSLRWAKDFPWGRGWVTAAQKNGYTHQHAKKQIVGMNKVLLWYLIKE